MKELYSTNPPSRLPTFNFIKGVEIERGVHAGVDLLLDESRGTSTVSA